MTEHSERNVESAVMSTPQPGGSRSFDLDGIRTQVRGDQTSEPTEDVGDR